MAANVKEFLENYGLYERFLPRTGPWWNGDWPDAVEVTCRACGERRRHTVFASKVAGATPGRGVYMVQGTCSTCYDDSLIIWIEVNHREGWMQKAGQLPGSFVQPEVFARPA